MRFNKNDFEKYLFLFLTSLFVILMEFAWFICVNIKKENELLKSLIMTRYIDTEIQNKKYYEDLSKQLRLIDTNTYLLINGYEKETDE